MQFLKIGLINNAMNKCQVSNQEINYELKRSKRAKRMRLSVFSDASVVVTLPYFANENLVEKFIREKSVWLFEKILHFKNIGTKKSLLRLGGKRDYLKNKKAARQFIEGRIALYNKIYNFSFNKIAVRRQKTRWGSCSSKKNLNYNYKILFLPLHLADYIIVHELCHLKEFNHGKKFWDLVAVTMPGYLAFRKELKIA